MSQPPVVLERPLLGVRFDEKIEWIVDRHISDQIYFDLELAHRVRKDIARQPIPVRVLLVVHKVIVWRDFQRMGNDMCAGMGCRP